MSIAFLIEAVIQNDPQKVKKLLEFGADPNGYEDAAKLSPLHFAALYNAADVVLPLVEAGADLQAKNADGYSPLEIAHQHGHDEVIRILDELRIS